MEISITKFQNNTFKLTFVQNDIQLKQLEDPRDTQNFFNLVEKNRKYLEPHEEWVDGVKSI